MQVKVFNNGQIIIPVNLRKKYNINIGEKVNIIEDKDGLKIVPIKKKKNILEFAGIFSNYSKKITEDEINSITEKSFVNGYKDEIY